MVEGNSRSGSFRLGLALSTPTAFSSFTFHRPGRNYGVTVSGAIRVVDFVAWMLTVRVVVTVFVATVKVAVVFPDVTVTLLGTVATDVKLLESVTTVPLAGALPFSVTVPVD